MSGRVLVVDDDRDMCELVAAGLERRGFDVEWTTSGATALDRVRSEDLDVVVTDVEMAGMNGIELCERVVADRPDVPVTMLSAFGDFDAALAAWRVGASDFITKPLEMDTLVLAVERAIRARGLRAAMKRLATTPGTARRFEEIVGTSPSIRRVVELLERVVDSRVSVLITGESGTGKELVARALHRGSRNASGPFVAVNCAAVPEPLLESELFGHVRGAFTDAREDRAGLFVQAQGGTLFLDEIADLPIRLQPKLLRALQERKIRPVGSDRQIAYDARLITATNQNLAQAVAQGHFREDLYFRINVLQIDVPPLRMRENDVLLLAQHFLRHYAAQADKDVREFSPAAGERLLAYPWPGNVRELQNCVERAVALARYDVIGVDDLADTVRGQRRATPLRPRTASSDLSLKQLELRHILSVLETVKGNRTLAAQTLGIDRKTLRRKLGRQPPTS